MRTPLYEEHVKLKATIVDFAGWDMPVYYTTPMQEHLACRSHAALFDICHMGEIFVKGKDAEALVQMSVTKDISGMPDGKIHLGCLCNEKGGVIDDLTAYKFSSKKFLIVVNASNIENDFNQLKKIAKDNNFKAEIDNESSNIAKLDLQGPNSEKILKQLTDYDLAKIGYYCFAEDKLLGKRAIISRSGYTGEDGFELYVDSENAAELWGTLLEKGASFGLVPAGLGSRDTLRLEAAMNLYGHEMDEKVSPLECRYSWIVSFSKDFFGKEALLRQKQEGVKRKLVGIEMIDHAIARNGYKVFKEGKEIGKITSGSFSPTLKKNIALTLIDSGFAKEGDELEVEVRGGLYRAKIIKLPFYKRGVFL